MPRYKKKRASSGEESDEDYDPEQDDEQSSTVPLQGTLMTSSGRLTRPSGTIKQERRSSSEELIEDAKEQQHSHSALRRIKVHETDRTFAPNLSKIAHYLMAIRCTRADSIHRLTIEQQKRYQTGEPTLAKFWTSNRFESESDNEIAGWKRVDDIGPSLARWLGTHSIALVVHGAVPKEMLEYYEDDGQQAGRPPVPMKIPGKRGRPRKEDLEKRRLLAAEEKKKKEAKPARLIEETTKPITVNERLHSLVDQSIAHRSSSRISTTGTSAAAGRRTNNSMAIALSQQPSTSTSSSAGPPQESPFHQLKRIKMEVEDFSLPSDFSTGMQISSNPRLPSTSQQPAQSNSLPHQPPSTTYSALETPIHNAADKPTTSSTATASLPEPTANNHQQIPVKKKKKPAHGGLDLPIQAGEQGTEHIRLALFNARPFRFDVDQSLAVHQFESVQVADIFHTLPPKPEPLPNGDERLLNHANPSEPSNTKQNMSGSTTYAEIEAHIRQGKQQQTSWLPPMDTIDRLVLRQGKRPHQHGQALFCGGPIAAISVCPRPLANGHELFAIATFADEKSLGWPEDDTTSYVQMWKVDSNDLAEPAKLAFLLHLSDAPQICSLSWCPLIHAESSSMFKSPPSSPEKGPADNTSSIPNASDRTEIPLGLIAIGTNNGRIHIYSIPYQLDALLAKYTPNSPTQPLQLESTPLLTLRHPSISLPDNVDLDEIPLFGLQWSPFDGGKHIAAISVSGTVHIWDILRDGPELPILSLHFDDWQGPPMAIYWMEKDKVCVTSRLRQLRIYKLAKLSASVDQATAKLQLECDTTKSVGSLCCTCPLLFPGLISFDSIGFNYMGNMQQTPCYIWTQHQPNGTGSSNGDEDVQQVCATNLSNCHQIRISAVSVCPQSGICVSAGVDGRLCCSLNGRMAPREGLQRETETFMHGRTLLQLIRHTKKRKDEQHEHESNEERSYSHEECCAEKMLEVRVGDCALLEQKNERVCGRQAPEVCLDRRLESLTALDISHTNVGTSFCGGDSGFIFIMPCTL